MTTCPSGLPNCGSVTATESHDGRVATILIDRQHKLNALTLDMLSELESCLDDIASSPARVALVRTAGVKVFCVGADINAFSQLSAPDMWRRWITAGHRVFDRLACLPQPTIAVVDGLAAGGGLELALACDLRIATPDATFGLPETGLGTIPGWGGTERLTALVGPSRAKELILTRRRADADIAMTWGLINGIASESIDTELDRWITDLLGSAPIAQQVAKQLINASVGGAPSHTLEAIASGFTAFTDDFATGVKAFVGKSQPEFWGR
jgi:enoyl-CoA hydratase/carnithine racemase